MTEEERKYRKKKISKWARKLQVSNEEAEKFLDELADGMTDFKNEHENFNIVGLDGFGTNKKEGN
jgi:nucleoid DNA-binding protein